MTSFYKRRISFTADLEEAIQTLTLFNQENEAQEKSGLQKTVTLMRNFFIDLFTEKEAPISSLSDQKERHRLLRAIHILKNNVVLIDKLLTGNAQQQKLGSLATATIERYNSIIERESHQSQNNLNTRIHISFQRQSLTFETLEKIPLPPFTCLKREFFEREESKKIPLEADKNKSSPSSFISSWQKIAFISQEMVSLTPLPFPVFKEISKQDSELFQMKAIALIEKYGLLSNREARLAMRKAQFEVMASPLEHTCLVSCLITAFPGHTIVVKGLFKKTDEGTHYGVLDPKSFCLSFNSTQSGFPHPLQNHGGALPDLISKSLFSLQPESSFSLFYEKKQQLAQKLLKNEQTISHAKKWIDLKRQAFETQALKFLDQHHRLTLAFLQAASPHISFSPHRQEVIAPFFHSLQSIYHPYDYLAETYHIINETFISKPFEKMQQAILEEELSVAHLSAIFNQEIKQAKQDLLRVKETASELQKKALDFILCLGEIWSTALGDSLVSSCITALSSFKEVIPCPSLNAFEKKIILISYQQVQHFIDDFDKLLEIKEQPAKELPQVDIIAKQMSHYLTEEINLWSSLSSNLPSFKTNC